MSVQHTPGPWRLVVRATQAGISRLTVTTDGRGGTCWTATAKHLTEQHRADARIMTAAPDLLEACKAHEAVTEYSDSLVALSMDGTRITPQHMEKGRQLMERAKILRQAAIAKAEGRTA